MAWIIPPYKTEPVYYAGWRGPAGLGVTAAEYRVESEAFWEVPGELSGQERDAYLFGQVQTLVGYSEQSRLARDATKRGIHLSASSKSAYLIQDTTARSRALALIATAAGRASPPQTSWGTPFSPQDEPSILGTLEYSLPFLGAAAEDAARKGRDAAANIIRKGGGVIAGSSGWITAAIVIAGIIAVGYTVRAFK